MLESPANTAHTASQVRREWKPTTIVGELVAVDRQLSLPTNIRRRRVVCSLRQTGGWKRDPPARSPVLPRPGREGLFRMGNRGILGILETSYDGY